jgi:hypothetical protein
MCVLFFQIILPLKLFKPSFTFFICSRLATVASLEQMKNVKLDLIWRDLLGQTSCFCALHKEIWVSGVRDRRIITSALNGSEWSASRRGRFNPGKEQPVSIE